MNHHHDYQDRTKAVAGDLIFVEGAEGAEGAEARAETHIHT